MTSSPSPQWTGSVGIVTGASSGLGLAIARALASQGAHVVITARHRDRLEQAAAALRAPAAGEILPLACDVANRNEVDQLVAATLARFGRIDVLVNNAGTGMIAPFVASQPADIAALFATNFFGVVNCLQAVLPQMQRQHRGHIINIGSVGGLRGIPNISIYSASKAALLGLSEAVRLEVKDHGIHVTVVCVARISDTAFFEQAKTYGAVQLYDVLASTSPETVAAAVIKAIQRRSRLVILPWRARLLYAVHKLAPSLMDHFLHRHMPRLETSRNREPK